MRAAKTTIRFKLTRAEDARALEYLRDRKASGSSFSKSVVQAINVKQRTLGYAPQPIIPESVFLLLEKIGQLQDLAASPETDAAICTLLKEISDTLLLPRKEGIPWLLPDSGP